MDAQEFINRVIYTLMGNTINVTTLDEDVVNSLIQELEYMLHKAYLDGVGSER